VAATALLSGLLLAAVAGDELPAVSPEVRQSWEDDYASLKAALSNRNNRYALLRTGDERKDVAHIQSLIWRVIELRRTSLYRRTEALLRHLRNMPKAPDLEALEKPIGDRQVQVHRGCG